MVKIQKYFFILFYIYIITHDMVFFPKINYVDDMIFFVAFLTIILSALTPSGRTKFYQLWDKADRQIMIFLALYLIVGLLSTTIFQQQQNIIAILTDIEYQIKFFIIFLGGRLWSKDLKNGLLRDIIPIAKILLVLITLGGFLSIFMNIGLSDMSQIRYGLNPYVFLYSSYTYLVLAVVYMMVPILAVNQKHKLYWEIGATFVLLSTLRSKAFMFVICYFLFQYIWKNRNKISRGILNIGMLIAGSISIAAVYNMLTYYFEDPNLPRSSFYSTGIRIAQEYFPFGSGFGSFANATSYKYGSLVYQNFGIQALYDNLQWYAWGFDVFWPNIYGQFGVIGLLIYLYMLILIIKSLLSKLNHSNERKIFMGLMLITYLIIASLAEAVFFNFSACSAALILSVYIMGNSDDKNI